MKFTEAIFDTDPSAVGSKVPLSAYQYYILTRSRMDREFDLATDRGRFLGLLWYLQHYCPGKLPLRAPLPGRQIAWLLEPVADYMSERPIPRVAHAFWSRSLEELPNPFKNKESYTEFAYWWSVEQAPRWALEHALVHESFIGVLTAANPGPQRTVEPNNFMRIHLAKQGAEWNPDSEVERLGNYVAVLLQPMGLHHSLFFPEKILTRFANADLGTEDLTGFASVNAADARALREKAVKAISYRNLHKKLRSGRLDVSAASIGRGWAIAGATTQQPQTSAHANAKVDLRLPYPVRVIGPVNSQSGLGQATRMSIEALRSVGVEPEIVDFYLENPAPRSSEYSSRVDVSLDKPSINLLHLNGEAIPPAAAYLNSGLFEKAYNIGYFFWELPRAARCHELAMRQLNEVWVSSEFNREVYERFGACPITKVGMAVEHLTPTNTTREQVRSAYDLPAEATIFMVTLDGYSFLKRKNPIGAVKAFHAAFPAGEENVRLVIKAHNLMNSYGITNVASIFEELSELCNRDHRVILIDKTLPLQDLLALKAACDVYVSLHRSEGWGFGLIEAMQLSIPVIATGFSGNLEFCTPETSYLVPHGQAFLEADDYIFVQAGDYWAEPNIQAAANFMKQAYDDPEQARKKGAAGKTFVETLFNRKAIGDRYVDRLLAISEKLALAT